MLGTGDGSGSDDRNTTDPGKTTPSGQPTGPATCRPGPVTKGESLGWLSWGIPALLLGGLLAGVASPGLRIVAQPGHPVWRGIGAAGNYLARFVRRGRRRGSP